MAEMEAGTVRSGHNRGAEIAFNDFLRTGPDTIAGRYLRSFWQPVCRGADVPAGKVKPLRIMNEDFAIYRGTDEKPVLVEARCAHRGAKLSIGWVEGNTIKCAYHGWSYDASGQCVRQPAEPNPFCDKVKIRTYPTHQYLGLVFAYLGDGEAPAFPRSPEFESDKYYYMLTTDIWPANYWAQLENSIDYAHTEFLHWHFHFKTPDRVEVSETPYGVKVLVPGLSDQATHYDTMYFVMPNTHEWAGPPPPKDPAMGSFARSWRIPRDDESHIRFDFRVFPFGNKDDQNFRERVEKFNPPRAQIGNTGAMAQKILAGELDFQALKDDPSLVGSALTTVQDCTVMASLGPMASREHKEMLGQTDLAIAHLRRLWKQELQAFAAGDELRPWKRPASLWEALAPAPDA
jgi:5,5'-dehydrodivanillate O-demethylase oxygenase subunit